MVIGIFMMIIGAICMTSNMLPDGIHVVAAIIYSAGCIACVICWDNLTAKVRKLEESLNRAKTEGTNE